MMQGVVHEFEPREGGRLRMSLTCEDPGEGTGGKMTWDTYTSTGFVWLALDKRVGWLVEFVSDQPAMSGKMQVT